MSPKGHAGQNSSGTAWMAVGRPRTPHCVPRHSICEWTPTGACCGLASCSAHASVAPLTNALTQRTSLFQILTFKILKSQEFVFLYPNDCWHLSDNSPVILDQICACTHIIVSTRKKPAFGKATSGNHQLTYTVSNQSEVFFHSPFIKSMLTTFSIRREA